MPVVISQETTPSTEGSDAEPSQFQADQLKVMKAGAFLLPVFGGETAPAQVPRVPRNGPWSGTTVSGSAPHVRLSPVTPTGLPTRGFTIGIPSSYGVGTALVTGEVDPVSTGFVLKVYVRNPGTWSWFQLEDLTALEDKLYAIGDLNACELYFSIDIASIATINGTAYAATLSTTIGYVPLEIMETG